MQTTKAQTSQPISAVLSVPLLFPVWNALKLYLLYAMFQYSSYIVVSVSSLVGLSLTLILYSIIRPFDAFETSHIFENNMENGAFALSEQMYPFP